MDPWTPQTECGNSVKDCSSERTKAFDDSFVESKDTGNANGEPVSPVKKLADTDKYLNKLCKYAACT